LGATVIPGQPKRVIEALETIGVAVPGRDMQFRVQSEINSVVENLADQSCSEAVASANKLAVGWFFGWGEPRGTTLQLDEQHSRPQRKKSRGIILTVQRIQMDA
jgi:hypothetical protein